MKYIKNIIIIFIVSLTSINAEINSCSCNGYWSELEDRVLNTYNGSVKDFSGGTSSEVCSANVEYQRYYRVLISTQGEMVNGYIFTTYTNNRSIHKCKVCNDPTVLHVPPEDNATHYYEELESINCRSSSAKPVQYDFVATGSINCCLYTVYYKLHEFPVPITCPTNQSDINGTCMPDLDGDGIPDSADPDIDGDGIPNADDSTPNGNSEPDANLTTCLLNTFNCHPCNCPTGSKDVGSMFIATSGKVYLGICNSGFSKYCDDGTDPSSANDDDSSCSHPSELFGYPFQNITTRSGCDLHTNNGALGIHHTLIECNLGEVACYYVDNQTTPDNNSSSNPIDNNTSTPSEGNSSSPLDVNSSNIGLGSKLDAINQSLSSTGNISNKLSSLSSEVYSLGGSLGNKLDTIARVNVSASNTLIDKLSSIEDAIKEGNSIDLNSSKDSKDIDLNETNDLLRENNSLLGDLNNSLNRTLTDDNTQEITDAIEGGKTQITDALESFLVTGNDIRAIANNLAPPTVTAGGDCTLNTSTPRLGNVKMEFNSVETLRPPLQFILNLFLFFFTMKLYIAIARDITSYFVGGL